MIALERGENLRSYELTVIIDPEIAEEDVPQAVEKLTELIARGGGNIVGWSRYPL